jgi:cytochrome P450
MNERKLNNMEQITFTDLLSQETKRDPVAFSARLREQGPLIHLTSPFGMGESWIVTTYDDAIAILKDPRFIKDTQKVSKPSDGQDAARESASVLPCACITGGGGL